MGFLIRRTGGIPLETKFPLKLFLQYIKLVSYQEKTEWILEYSLMHYQLYNSRYLSHSRTLFCQTLLGVNHVDLCIHTQLPLILEERAKQTPFSLYVSWRKFKMITFYERWYTDAMSCLSCFKFHFNKTLTSQRT